MRAPDFWTEKSMVSNLLAPAGAIVSSIAWIRSRTAHPQQIKAPVVCVGNLVAGGAGKTPVALSLAERLNRQGAVVHFLSRGYGGRLRGPHRVDEVSDNVNDVGDEALLLARVAPTWVSADRVVGARLAETNGAEIILMDDGFQNFSLAKSLSVLVIDAEYGFGNHRVMPAGPLRESISCGCRRADLAVLLGGDNENLRQVIPRGVPVLRASITAESGFQSFASRSLVAFAGIGRPGKFFTTLRTLDCKLVESIPFPDHHVYTTQEISDLKRRAETVGAVLVTTEKDKVRIPDGLQHLVEVLPVEVVWENEQVLDDALARVYPPQVD